MPQLTMMKIKTEKRDIGTQELARLVDDAVEDATGVLDGHNLEADFEEGAGLAAPLEHILEEVSGLERHGELVTHRAQEGGADGRDRSVAAGHQET